MSHAYGKSLLESVKIMRRVGRQRHLGARAKGSTLASLLSLELMSEKRFPNPISLFGFQVAYAGANSLKYLVHEIFFDQIYNLEFKSPTPRILDCGSNIGLSVLYFKTLAPDAEITCFEPDPATYEILTRNIALNGLKGINSNNCALAGKDGTVEFFRSPRSESSLLMSTRPERMPGIKIEVPARRLSSFVSSDIDLLKLDVEGAETQVLAELAAAGALRRIQHIHLEYHHHITESDDNFSEILGLLEEAGFGYQLRAYSPRRPKPGAFQDVAVFCYRRPLPS